MHSFIRYVNGGGGYFRMVDWENACSIAANINYFRLQKIPHFGYFYSMLKTSLLVAILIFYCCTSAEAQVFGGNSPRLKFYQLNTDSVRVIFPKALEKEAREIAWIVHELNRNNPDPLGRSIRKFNLVLQNQTVQSNGYVGIAPYRSEYFMMPPLDNVANGSIPWHLSLAVHEHRHMEQFANFNKVVPKVLGVLLGQQGQALGIGGAIPNWFFEGDAVWQETIATQQGRGRLPNFFNAYRSLWLADKHYSYMKLRNGSFRHFVPNHYDLGYLLVGYGREKYGADFWKKVTDDAVNYQTVLYPMQGAIKKYAGVKFKSFVRHSFEWYQQQMELKQGELLNNFHPITKGQRNNVSFYHYPFVRNNGSILTLTSGFRQIPVWIAIDENGKQKKLRVKDIGDDNYYSFSNNFVVYTAYEPHARWGWKDYSVVKLWNTSANKVFKLSSKSRLFMPDIATDASKVVAMQYTADMKSNLVLMDAAANSQQQVLPNPNGYLYTYPKFSNENKSIISAIRNSKGEMTLLETDIAGNNETLLMPFVNTAISFVQVQGDAILFTSAQREGDVLYLFNKQTRELFKLTGLPNGNYQAYLDKKTNNVVWSTFTADGYVLLKDKLDKLQLKKVDGVDPLPQLYLSAKTFASSKDLVSNLQQQPGEIKKYKQSFQLLNIHSWRPLLTAPDYGITFFSENILNTFTGEYNYTYNRNEGFHRVGASVVYGGFFPLLSAGVAQTWNRSERDTANRRLTWNQSNINAGLSVPLNLTSGRTYKSLAFLTSFNAEQLHYTGIAKSIKANESFEYISSAVSFVNQNQRAVQHILPRWAQTFRLQYRRTVNGDFGNQFLANAGLYFPGLHVNHNLVLFASVFARDTTRGGKFTNSFPFARGYNVLNFPRMWRVSTNYHFPIAYPDWGFGNILYFLRIRANAFYDYTRGRSLRTGNEFPFRTAGAEIYFDTKIWNLFQASFGVRYNRLLDADRIDSNRNPNQFEFVLPLDLF